MTIALLVAIIGCKIFEKELIMSDEQMKCPKCQYDYPYEDGEKWVCPDCQYEWNPAEEAAKASAQEVICDINGNELKDGDSVTVIKDLKVKGASGSIKVGTKVKKIRLIHDAADQHDIACKIDGFGAINITSKFVKKS